MVWSKILTVPHEQKDLNPTHCSPGSTHVPLSKTPAGHTFRPHRAHTCTVPSSLWTPASGAFLSGQPAATCACFLLVSRIALNPTKAVRSANCATRAFTSLQAEHLQASWQDIAKAAAPTWPQGPRLGPWPSSTGCPLALWEQGWARGRLTLCWLPIAAWQLGQVQCSEHCHRLEQHSQAISGRHFPVCHGPRLWLTFMQSRGKGRSGTFNEFPWYPQSRLLYIRNRFTFS